MLNSGQLMENSMSTSIPEKRDFRHDHRDFRIVAAGISFASLFYLGWKYLGWIDALILVLAIFLLVCIILSKVLSVGKAVVKELDL